MSKAELFSRTSDWLDRGARALRGIHDGIWLGLMRPSDLNELTTRCYNVSRIYLDETYNLTGFFPWEIEIVDRFFADRRSVLVGAAGGGREMIAFARRGFRVDGFECNPVLRGLANRLLDQERLDARLVPAASDEVPATLGRYDGGVIGYGAYSHVSGRQNRIRFLEAFRLHLEPGAPVLVSYQLRGESRKDALVSWLAGWLRRVRRDDRRAEVGDKLLSDRFEHWFTCDEMRAEIDEAGMDLEHLEAPFAVARVRKPIESC